MRFEMTAIQNAKPWAWHSSRKVLWKIQRNEIHHYWLLHSSTTDTHTACIVTAAIALICMDLGFAEWRLREKNSRGTFSVMLRYIDVGWHQSQSLSWIVDKNRWDTVRKYCTYNKLMTFTFELRPNVDYFRISVRCWFSFRANNRLIAAI